MNIFRNLSTVLVIALFLPSYHLVSQQNAPAIECTERTGHVIDQRFDSKTARMPVQYRAYLPPCYALSHKRYPYVLLMSGNDGDETEWTDRLKADVIADAEISLQNLPPMILIMPDGGPLMNLNAFPPLRSWETVVTDELLPSVESAFCVQQFQEGRAIGGISRGGFWAFEIAFRHPDLFSAIGGHSPVFGQIDISSDDDPLALAATVQPDEPPRIWLDIGDQDISLPAVQQLNQILSDHQFDVTFNVSPDGDHSDNYWRSHMGNYLEFYGLNWTKDIEQLPDCDK